MNTEETVSVVAADPGGGSGGVDRFSSQTESATVAAAFQVKLYDLDGNLTDDGLWTYTWDAENRLIAMQTTSTAAGLGIDNHRIRFYYDYMHRRVRKEVAVWDAVGMEWDLTSDRRFAYEGWNVIHEEETVTGQERTYAWGLDLVGSLTTSGGVGV